jgi:hypothetical protein
MAAAPNPAEAYLPRQRNGAFLTPSCAGFAGETHLDDPLSGAVRGQAALRHIVEEKPTWLAQHQPRMPLLRTLRAGGHSVHAALLYLQLPAGEMMLPIAVVGAQCQTRWSTAGGRAGVRSRLSGRLCAARLYDDANVEALAAGGQQR